MPFILGFSLGNSYQNLTSTLVPFSSFRFSDSLPWKLQVRRGPRSAQALKRWLMGLRGARGPGSSRCWGGGRGGESGRGGEAAPASGSRRRLRMGGKCLWGRAGGECGWLQRLGAGVAARAGRCLSVKVLGGVVLTFLMPRAGRRDCGCLLLVGGRRQRVLLACAGAGVAMPALGALPRVSESQLLPCPSPSPLARVCARCTCVCVQGVHAPAAVLAPLEEQWLFRVVYFWVHEIF